MRFYEHGGEWWIRTTEAEATDLQSVPFSHSGNSPKYPMSHLSGSNQRPTDYKSVALPAELKWRLKERISFTENELFSLKGLQKKAIISILQNVSLKYFHITKITCFNWGKNSGDEGLVNGYYLIIN